MPLTRPNLTRNRPRPAARRPRRPVRISGGTGAPISQVIYPWNFAVRIWIAFDPPTAPLPTWIEVTGYVEHENPITITHGRTDGIADVNASTMSLTADNTSGIWSEGNPNGAWYGQIHKGSWIKVEVIPPSGLVSTRFVGFITDLPTGWAGEYASSLITASDRFEKLGRAKSIVSQIQSEVLTDPNLAGNVQAYWNLHETPSLAYGAYTFGDTSGVGASPLKSSSIGGVPAGTGFTPANANAPGFDSLRAAAFNPPSAGKGTILTGTVAMPPGVWDVVDQVYAGLFGTIEFWFQAVTANTTQMLAALVDPVSKFAVSIYIDSGGILRYAGVGSAPSNPNTYFSFNSTVNAPRVDDGAWHHIVVGMAVTGSSGGSAGLLSVQDGYWLQLGGAGTGAGIPGGNLTQIIVGGGYDPANPGILTPGASNLCDVAWTWADINYLWDVQPAQFPPNYAAHYAAGNSGNLGESTDRRIARVMRYAGVPVPHTYVTDAYSGQATIGQVAVYTPAPGPWTNLSPGAHYCGTQSMSGRKPLDVAQEAARTEAMPVFIDRAGYAAIQPSTLRQNTVPAWTVDARDLDPSTGQINNFTYLVNQITITPNGQAAQTVIGPAGAASQDKYGEYDGAGQATASLTPLEAQNLGLAIIAGRADPPPRLSPVAVEIATLATQAGYGPAWFDAVLATEISTPFRITNIPAAIGGGTADALVEGWTETITSGNILFSFATSPVQGPTYQLDSATLGLLDTPGITLAY